MELRRRGREQSAPLLVAALVLCPLRRECSKGLFAETSRQLTGAGPRAKAKLLQTTASEHSK